MQPKGICTIDTKQRRGCCPRCSKRCCHCWLQRHHKRLRALHAEGLTDAEIAKAMTRNRDSVAKVRRSLGLKAHRRERSDPEVRGRCNNCRGPIYVDEPGHNCPDCQTAIDAIVALRAEERQLASLPEPSLIPTISLQKLVGHRSREAIHV